MLICAIAFLEYIQILSQMQYENRVSTLIYLLISKRIV